MVGLKGVYDINQKKMFGHSGGEGVNISILPP